MKTGLKVVSILELIIGIVILLFGLINIVLFAAGDGQVLPLPDCSCSLSSCLS